MIRIGKIVATHGLQGGMIFKHVAGESNWLLQGAVLFVEVRKDSQIPYFVVTAKASNHEEYIVTVEDIATVEAAKKLVGKQVYVKEDVLKDVKNDTPLMWIGFNLVDREKDGLGAIEDVLQTGHQWLAKLTIEGKEVLIPLVDDILVEVNMRNKFVRVDLPEGLLEVYLQ
ncbi:16S rRNA processing protein RimM [Chitinophagaceae bacterium IBVUCB1]|nr:16S rRNA processing protein RimM [Chitinophagaceae bacterium IBVUCB1]